MQITAKYSYMNGEEYLIVRQADLWQEVQEVIAAVDGESCPTRRSHGRSNGQIPYSPIAMSKAFATGFAELGWQSEARVSSVTSGKRRRVFANTPETQEATEDAAGEAPKPASKPLDFFKDRVAVEVQIGRHDFGPHDLFAKHLSLFVSDVIDVGIEILPLKELEASLSSGGQSPLNARRGSRGVPSVPLVLIGITP